MVTRGFFGCGGLSPQRLVIGNTFIATKQILLHDRPQCVSKFCSFALGQCQVISMMVAPVALLDDVYRTA